MIVTIVVCAIAIDATAQSAPTIDTRLYRLFLNDGSNVVCYGEFARVGGRVVFSIPLGETTQAAPPLQLVSLPEDRIDWAKTDAYSAGVRAAHYAATRGDEDYAQLTNEVATILNDIANAPDASSRLALAERVRPLIAKWPGDHHGHRAADVQQVLALLDEVIAELRAQNGQQQFDLTLVGGQGLTAPPPALLPAPTLKDVIEQALTLSRAVDLAEDRLALLGVSSTLVHRHEPELPAEWARRARTEIARETVAEMSVEKSYARLQTRILAQAARAAERADVRGVQRTIDRLGRTDAELGRRRPQLVHTLMTTLQARLDAAQRLRLARDQWLLRRPALRAYRSAMHAPVMRLVRARPLFEDIRAMAGPAPSALESLDRLVASAGFDVQGATVPPEMSAAHAMLASALQMATSAVRLRRAAVTANAVDSARDASAAAAGAMMLLDRARTELERLSQPPKLP